MHGLIIAAIIIAGTAVFLYLHRAYVEAVIAKAEVTLHKDYQELIDDLHAGYAQDASLTKEEISTLITDAKVEAAKAETTAPAIVTKIETDLKNIL